MHLWNPRGNLFWIFVLAPFGFPLFICFYIYADLPGPWKSGARGCVMPGCDESRHAGAELCDGMLQTHWSCGGRGYEAAAEEYDVFSGAWLLHNLPVPLLLPRPAWSAGQVAAAGKFQSMRDAAVPRWNSPRPWCPQAAVELEMRPKVLRHMGTGEPLCSQSRAGSIPLAPMHGC